MSADAEIVSPVAAPVSAPRRFRSLEAAAIAGLLFGVLFIVALLLFRREPGADAPAGEISAWLAEGDANEAAVTALYLVSFSVIALLWFVAVVRRRIGEREDRFFATVFFGSGILAAGLLLVGSTLLATPALLVNARGADALDVSGYAQLRSVGETMFAIHGLRIASVFMFSASTVVLRARILPRWLAIVGYLAGLSMLVDPLKLLDEFYVFPAWVILVSVFLFLRRDTLPPRD